MENIFISFFFTIICPMALGIGLYKVYQGGLLIATREVWLSNSVLVAVISATVVTALLIANAVTGKETQSQRQAKIELAEKWIADNRGW